MTAPGQPTSQLGEHQIIRAGHGDTDVLSEVIAEAFFPLAVCQWLVPDESARHEMFPGFFRLYVEHALADGLIDTSPQRDCAALWLPGTGPAEPPAGYPQRLAAITGQQIGRFMAFDEELERHHPAGILHHHLALIAVRPGRQGLGIGAALLRAHHAELDKLGTPAYLEASAMNTRRIYLGHGYTDHGDPINLPGGPQMYPMVRRPKSHNPSESAGRRADMT